MKSQQKAYLAALLFAIIIGFSFMFVKISLTVASPLDTLAHRFSLSIVAATLPFCLKRRGLNISWHDLRVILPLAMLYPTCFFLFQVFGLVYTSSSEAGIIQAAVPIFTVLLAERFLRERVTPWQKLSILLSVSGVIYIFVMKSASIDLANVTGAVLILLSALSSAGYNVLARKLTRQFPLQDLTYVMTAIAAVVFNSLALTQHYLTQSLDQFFLPFFHLDFVVSILYLSILSSLGTSLLSNYALTHLEASKMSVFSNLATLITIVTGAVVLQENIYYYHIGGAVIILAGVIGTNYFGKKSA